MDISSATKLSSHVSLINKLKSEGVDNHVTSSSFLFAMYYIWNSLTIGMDLSAEKEASMMEIRQNWTSNLIFLWLWSVQPILM